MCSVLGLVCNLSAFGVVWFVCVVFYMAVAVLDLISPRSLVRTKVKWANILF